MRRLVFSLYGCLGVLTLCLSSSAAAHVLVVDEQSGVAVVLHSNPDDDPIAGETTELYFDVQDKQSTARIPYSGYQVEVIDQEGVVSRVESEVLGTTVKGLYVFPSRGLYTVALTSKPQYDQFQKVRIESSLRVERGTGADAKQEDYTLWQVLGISSAVALVLLGTYFFNNRREILDKSSF